MTLTLEVSRTSFYFRAFGRELYIHDQHYNPAGRSVHPWASNRVWHLGRFEVIYSRQ